MISEDFGRFCSIRKGCLFSGSQDKKAADVFRPQLFAAFAVYTALLHRSIRSRSTSSSVVAQLVTNLIMVCSASGLSQKLISTFSDSSSSFA